MDVQEQPAVEPTEPVAVEPDTLEHHEASFGPKPTQPDDEDERPHHSAEQRREDTGQFKDGKVRHRAQSQKATAADVPRIAELTKNWRAEQERASKLEAELSQLRSSSTQLRNEAPAATRTKPSEDEIGAKYQTYADYVEDLADWKYEQRRAAEKAESDKTTQASQQEAATREVIQTFASRVSEFVKTTPDYHEKVNAAAELDNAIPLSLERALMLHDNGPAIVYHLATHPQQFDEMRLLAASVPLDQASVALLQRRLSAYTHTQAGTTGSAAVQTPAVVAPRPPNPVRSGSMSTGDDLPGDESSLAEHEKAYNRPRRR